MRPHAWFMDAIELRAYRHTIERVNSQLEKMGIERLYARTNAGFELKVHATPDMTTLSREVTAWEERRNKACRKVVWHVTADARIKLRRLYPVVKEQNLT